MEKLEARNKKPGAVSRFAQREAVDLVVRLCKGACPKCREIVSREVLALFEELERRGLVI